MGILNKKKRKDADGEPLHRFEMGGAFIAELYDGGEENPRGSYTRISTVSGNFEMKLTGFVHGYLMESARQGIVENIHGFCALVYSLCDGVYQDPQFAADLMKAYDGYYKRLMKKARSEARKIDRNKEKLSQAVMEDVVERGEFSDLDDQRRQKAANAARAEMEAFINHEDEDENPA